MDGNCRFFTNGEFLSLCLFLCITFYLTLVSELCFQNELKLTMNEWNDIMIKERQKNEFMVSFVYKNNNEKGLESIEIAFADIF